MASLDNPPPAIVAGSDGVEWALSVLKNDEAQIEAWRELSVSTDGDWSDGRTDGLHYRGSGLLMLSGPTVSTYRKLFDPDRL